MEAPNYFLNKATISQVVSEPLLILKSVSCGFGHGKWIAEEPGTLSLKRFRNLQQSNM
jgi:hypothetical protein